MVIIIGLTGSIATGKSTASKHLEKLGCNVVDGDMVAREVAEESNVLDAIEETFGKEFLNKEGKLLRKKLGSMVFNDGEALQKLNEIMYPAIRNKIADQLARFKKSAENRSQEAKTSECIVIDGALLIEMNLHTWVDEVWLVAITKDEQIRRLMNRDAISKTDAQRKIESQMSTSEKKKFADVVLDNSKDIEFLQSQIEQEFSRLMGQGKKQKTTMKKSQLKNEC